MPRCDMVILHSGGLRCLVGLASVLTDHDPATLAVLHLRDGKPGGATRADHARKQAHHFGITRHVEVPTLQLRPNAEPGSEPAATLVRPRLLMLGLTHALAWQATQVVWPVQVNADHPQVAKAAEQALLAEHLAALDHEHPPHIAMPLLELTDKQLIELGAHLDVPWELAWSCDMHQDRQCGLCPGCARRKKAFAQAGVVDPLFPGRAAG